MKRLPRMWDERMPGMFGQAGTMPRFCVHRWDLGCWTIEDVLEGSKRWALGEFIRFEYRASVLRGKGRADYFRSRKSAENFLKRTTMRAYQVRLVELKLDRGAA